ncbi:sulfotransferase family protein [Acetobacter persici]|uniref:sulfotransferase family protein n=1 Tax=Acetobacter persici TaxID=1076596 RepID=UPI0031FF0A91
MPTSSVHFMSGLPRSGSTLLSAILQQNPAVRHAGIITPVAPMMVKLSSLMVEGDYVTEFDENTRKRLLRGVFSHYYFEKSSADPCPSGMIIDNHRMWCTRLGLIDYLFPESRIICCVRNPVWIIDSFERLIQKDPALGSKLVPIEQRGTLYERVEALTAPNGVFGYCWRALQEAFYSTLAHKLIVVEYDRLVTDPERTVAHIARLLKLPEWRYNFEAVEFKGTSEFDQALNTPGLHEVRRKVAYTPRRPILPPDVVARLSGELFWRNPERNPGRATVLS